MGREAAIGAVAPCLHQIRCPRVPWPRGGPMPGLVVQPRHPSPALRLRRGISPHPWLGLVFLPRQHPHPPVPTPTLPPASAASSASCYLLSHPSARRHRRLPPRPHRRPTRAPQPRGVRAGGGGCPGSAAGKCELMGARGGRCSPGQCRLVPCWVPIRGCPSHRHRGPADPWEGWEVLGVGVSGSAPSPAPKPGFFCSRVVSKEG